MERRLARINSSTAGGTAGTGAKTHKVTLPSRWLQAMGITDENREVELAFDGHQIIITRVVTIEEFYDEKKAQSHSLKTLKFWNGDKKRLPTWVDLMAFLEERCVPRQREGIREYLDTLGLDEYDPWEIVKHTQGRMAEDQQWIEVVE